MLGPMVLGAVAGGVLGPVALCDPALGLCAAGLRAFRVGALCWAAFRGPS